MGEYRSTAVSTQQPVGENGKAYIVVFPDGGGFTLITASQHELPYPRGLSSKRRTLHTLEMLRLDLWLAHHNWWTRRATYSSLWRSVARSRTK